MTITTKRLRLRTVKIEDAQALYPIWSNQQVVQYTHIKHVNSVQDAESRITRHIDWLVHHNSIAPLVIEKENVIIGYCGISQKNSPELSTDIYYHLAESQWGNGYGTETARALLLSAFLEFNAKKVSASAVAVNKPSIQIFGKIGLEYSHTIPQGFENAQGTFDLLYYELKRAVFWADRKKYAS
jgi:ribosomal-protein-alanine N-acetyltransferase